MNLTINVNAAVQDITEIENIVKSIAQSMGELNEHINKNIPSGIETEWSLDLLDKWTTFYNNSIQGAMEGMLKSAENLQRDVDRSLAWEKVE